MATSLLLKKCHLLQGQEYNKAIEEAQIASKVFLLNSFEAKDPQDSSEALKPIPSFKKR